MLSPFARWNQVRQRLRSADGLVLFLDCDGTLAPIVKHASKAKVPRATRALLEQLARDPGVWTAVVSGRALEDVVRVVGVEGLCYVGNHGLELKGPELHYINPLARKSRPVIAEICRRLELAVRPVQGAWVEDKRLTLSLHTRMVAPPEKLLVRNAFYSVIKPYRETGKVRITSGKEVFEVRPPVRWTKGNVVSWLLARRQALAKGNLLPVYLGDDQTDEDAFQALGKKGITVLVGPKNLLSRAQYRVRSPSEAAQFLGKLLQGWKSLCAERNADCSGGRDQRRARRHVPRRA